MRKFSKPSPVVSGARDHFTIFDSMSALADYAETGSLSLNWSQTRGAAEKRSIRSGNMEDAKASDAFMAKLENVVDFEGARHAVIDDVTGAFPNVPAYIAGQPMNMRRKVKIENEASPIAIVTDGTVSAAVSHNVMSRRGAAILALARVLSARRPVELWHVAGLGGGNTTWCFTRIETAPMDLARAGFLLANGNATRVIGYGVCHAAGAYGAWPYSKGGPLNAADFEKVARSALPHVNDIVAVPGAHMNDEIISDPVRWIKARIGQFAGKDAE